jgi:hypothetical protein
VELALLLALLVAELLSVPDCVVLALDVADTDWELLALDVAVDDAELDTDADWVLLALLVSVVLGVLSLQSGSMSFM